MLHNPSSDGYYSITVNRGFIVLARSFISYSTDTLFVEIKRDLSHNFELQNNAYNLSEVTLEDSIPLNIESTRTSVISISKEKIKICPNCLVRCIYLNL